MPWGVNFHNEYSHELTGIIQGTPLHPTQLYEALLNFLNFSVLFLFLKKKKFDGQIFSMYIVNYSIIRYIVEFYRGDHPDKTYLIKNASSYLSMSYPQVFCILGLIGGSILFFVLKKRKAV
jgi:phosphatidylglycerol:prolipoprotein diacylglycerol transferase